MGKNKERSTDKRQGRFRFTYGKKLCIMKPTTRAWPLGKPRPGGITIMLKGKTVLLGITGGIAAYKAAYLASALVKLHANVEVVMTKNATQFITPLTFE